MTVTINGTGYIAGITDPLVRVRRDTDQSLVSGVTSAVAFNVADLDVTGSFNTATGVFTAPVAGWYEASWYVNLNNGASTMTVGLTVLQKNGIDFQRGGQINSAANFGTISSSGDTLVLLSAGDTLQLTAFASTSSGAPTVVGGASLSSMTIKLVRRA